MGSYIPFFFFSLRASRCVRPFFFCDADLDTHQDLDTVDLRSGYLQQDLLALLATDIDLEISNQLRLNASWLRIHS